MPNAFIAGTGFHVPPNRVTNDELVNTYGIDTTDEWIVQRTGIEARHFAAGGVATSDMALIASQSAIERAGLAARDLDMILLATLSPEYAFPGSGVLLQQKLGLPEADPPKFVPAMDIRNQCSGFVYGLYAANAMVRSGAARHVLLVGSEKHSAAIDLSTNGRSVSTLFGDGAGAVVISATEEDRGIRGVHLGSDGRFAEMLCQKVWDTHQRPFIPLNEHGVGQVQPDMMWARMEGRVVFKHAVERLSSALLEACSAHGLTLDDIDLFAFHQANLRVNQYVAQHLGLAAAKVVNNIERYGNTTAATIPILLAEAERQGTLTRGMKVATVAFGSGFTWGAAIIDW